MTNSLKDTSSHQYGTVLMKSNVQKGYARGYIAVCSLCQSNKHRILTAEV